MPKDMCINEAYEKYGDQPDWYRSATYCKGYSCPNYGSCKGNAAFEQLPKRGVTDAQLAAACEKEKRLGVWDRETNNY